MRFVMVIIFLLSLPGFTQTTDTKPEAKKPVVSTTARLLAAKTVYVRNTGTSELPYNVISSAMEGWARYTVVDSPEKADILVEVWSQDESGSGVSASTQTGGYGKPEQSATTKKEITPTVIKMTALDPKTRVTLWAGTERPKGAMKKRVQDDHIVESAQHLFQQFHDRVEPPIADAPPNPPKPQDH